MQCYWIWELFERHYGCKMIEGSLVERLPIVQSGNSSVKYYTHCSSCQNPCNQWVLIQLAIKCCSGSGVYILIPVTNLRDFGCEPVFRAEPNFLFRYAWNVEQANDFLERISSFYIHNSCVIKYMSYTYIRRIDTLHILKTDFTQEMYRDIKLIIYCTIFFMTIVQI